MLQQWVLPVTLIGRPSRGGSSQESRVLELGVDKKARAEVGSVAAWNDDFLFAVGARDTSEVVFETMRATVERLKTEGVSKSETLLSSAVRLWIDATLARDMDGVQSLSAKFFGLGSLMSSDHSPKPSIASLERVE